MSDARPDATAVTSDLPDLDEVPLADVAKRLDDAELAAQTVQRVAPGDGSQLLVAASFNSAI